MCFMLKLIPYLNCKHANFFLFVLLMELNMLYVLNHFHRRLILSLTLPVCLLNPPWTKYLKKYLKKSALTSSAWTLEKGKRVSFDEYLYHLMNTYFDQRLPHLNLKAVYEIGVIISFLQTRKLQDCMSHSSHSLRHYICQVMELNLHPSLLSSKAMV